VILFYFGEKEIDKKYMNKKFKNVQYIHFPLGFKGSNKEWYNWRSETSGAGNYKLLTKFFCNSDGCRIVVGKGLQLFKIFWNLYRY
jgi:hypothetical protein